MSAWRREASIRLPEFQRIIASRDVDNPMMLWIELGTSFSQLCQQDPPPFEVLKKFWGYARWCMKQKNDDVVTAAALAFCEHLLGSKAQCRVLSHIMSRQEYAGLKGLLLYHNSQEQYEQVLQSFGTGNSK
jgi:hypothetical protein